MPSTIIQQRAPSATRAVAASRGTRECQGISKASTFRLKFFGNCYSTYVCTTTLLLDFDYQLPCTFERPAASAGDRQLAAPRGRAVGQSGSLQAAVGRFSSQASYGLAWLYKKKSSFF